MFRAALRQRCGTARRVLARHRGPRHLHRCGHRGIVRGSHAHGGVLPQSHGASSPSCSGSRARCLCDARQGPRSHPDHPPLRGALAPWWGIIRGQGVGLFVLPTGSIDNYVIGDDFLAPFTDRGLTVVRTDGSGRLIVWMSPTATHTLMPLRDGEDATLSCARRWMTTVRSQCGSNRPTAVRLGLQRAGMTVRSSSGRPQTRRRCTSPAMDRGCWSKGTSSRRSSSRQRHERNPQRSPPRARSGGCRFRAHAVVRSCSSTTIHERGAAG
jgi:hypothetical protein